MGQRSTIILIHDSQHEWARDPTLGSTLAQACNASTLDRRSGFGPNYGYVVETTHADTQRLAVIDSYSMSTLAIGHWQANVLDKVRDLTLLKQAAEKLGYKLVKA